MEMQRWSTRWKTRRWPWDSALTVLTTFAILLRAAEVRGGKKAKGSRGVQPPLSPPRLGPPFRGNLSERLGRREGTERSGPARGAETRWEPPAARAGDGAPGCRGGGGSPQASAFCFGCTGGVGRWKKYWLNRVASPLPALHSILWSVCTIFGCVELTESLLCSSSPSCG